MIFFIIIMVCVAAATISWLMLSYHKKKIPADVKDIKSVLKNTCWYWIRECSICAFAIVMALTLVAIGVYGSEAKRLYDESENLNLYVEVVEESDNEYLRYNFWNEVHAHNSKVDFYREMPENIWFGWFIPHPDLYENIPYVNFALNGG